jgi:hypothetical protein
MVAKKSAKGHSAHKKQADPAQASEEIAGIVKSGARDITAAVMDQAMHGELAAAKYVFVVAGVYPPAGDGTQTTEEEDCLAKTLLDRLRPPHRTAEPSARRNRGKRTEIFLKRRKMGSSRRTKSRRYR